MYFFGMSHNHRDIRTTLTQPKILTKDEFSKEVENFVSATGTTFIDAILTICEKRNIEPETASKMLNGHCKNMVEREAMGLNLLVEKQQLTFE